MYENDDINPTNPLNELSQDKADSMGPSAPNEIFIGMGKHCALKEQRVFERRTRRDRRRVWKNPKYKGPERRHRKRRCVFNRRQVQLIVDDLGKNIP